LANALEKPPRILAVIKKRKRGKRLCIAGDFATSGGLNSLTIPTSIYSIRNPKWS